jgi:hypothetical protein
MSIKETLSMLVIALLLLSIGFFSGVQYTTQREKDKEQDAAIQFIYEQMPTLRSMYGS